MGRGGVQVRRAYGMNHYERLGVAVGARPDVIRDAYRRRARTAHPDATGSVDDDEMTAINEAWFVLRDPQRRRRYDDVIDRRAVDGRRRTDAGAGPGRRPGG